MRGIVRNGLIVVSIAFIVFSIFFIGDLDRASALTTVEGTESRLTIWDETDNTSYTVPIQLWKSGDNVRFVANFTNITSNETINDSFAYCEVVFNYNGSWSAPVNMTYNGTSELYEYTRNFYYRGTHTHNITCYGSGYGYDDIEASENFIIANTAPSISPYIPQQNCTEDDDSLCIFNFGLYVDDPDLNDILVYRIQNGTEFDNLIINSSTGISIVNCTTDDCAVANCTLGDCDGTFYPEFTGSDGTLVSGSSVTYCMYAVNDAPEFSPVPTNMTVYQSNVFYYDLNATDEENNFPLNYTMNITWCNRIYTSNASCDVFGMNSSTGIIDRGRNFTNNEVGVYVINFTVTDNGTLVQPYNASTSVLINITVLNDNDPPNITTILTEQVMWQYQSFYLEVNATDPENDSSTFSAITLYRNLSLYPYSPIFQFNQTNQTMYDNISVGIMNYTNISNSQVGNFTLNITAYDGNPNGTAWKLVNFTIYNVNDEPVLDPIGNHTAVQDVNFVLGINATDIDDFASYIPYTDPVNGTITYNISFLSGTPFFGINNETGVINFTANGSQNGTYVLNITATDGGNLTDSEIINITVVANYPPNITTVITNQTTTQNQTFYLEFNGTDADNSTQNITFYTQTYYRNMTLLSTNKFPVTNISNSSWPSQPVTGIMNYTNVTNNQVGNYTVRIILVDTLNVPDYLDVNFTVYNINDPPSIDSVSVTQTSYEDSQFLLDMNVTDIDYNTPYGDNTTFNITFLNGTPFFGIDNMTGIINFTVTNNSYEGSNYTVNISAWDSENITTWQIINLTHYTVNDYPQFDNLNLSLESRVFEEFLYQVNATDEESTIGNLTYNLTFTNDTQFFWINETTGLINFTVNESYIGIYLLNVTVTDNGYNSSFQGMLANKTNVTQVTLDIKSQNVPPSIDDWWTLPYQNPSNITLNENETIDFTVTISDQNNDSLTCNWSVNGVQNGDESELSSGLCTTGTIGSLATYTPTFQDSGTVTIRLTVFDGNSTDSFETNITVYNVNRPPQLLYLIGNQKWSMNTVNENINLSYHFVDPDNTNSVANDDNIINYILNVTPTHITASINQTSGKVTLTPDSDWYGNTTIKFVANDSEYTANSSIIQLNVTYVEAETVTITTSPGGSSSTTNTVTQTITETEIASLTIEAEPMIEVRMYEEIKTPLKLINTGDVDLSEISITAEDIDKTGEVDLTLKNTRIGNLLVDEEYNTELTIITKNLTQKRYQVKITGDVFDPDFFQSATIYLRTIEINKTSIEEKIRFVKDYFEDNPPCIELMELIVSAERALGDGNIIQAQNLTTLALDNCRDLIRYTSNMTYSRPAFIEANRVPADVVIVSVIMAIAIVVIATAHYVHTSSIKKKEKEEFLRKRAEERKKFHKPRM